MTLLLLLILTEPPSLKPRQIEKKIIQLTRSSPLQDGLWGVAVYAPLRKKFVVRLNERINFRTASNLKILTTLMAFDLLGPGYRFETEFGLLGEIRDSILEGDLIVQGRGDPSIAARQDAYRVSDLLQPVIDRLKALGVQSIHGDLIATTDWFSDSPIQPTWEWDDVGRWYGTPATPLSVDHGWMTLHLSVDESGGPEHGLSQPWSSDFLLTDNLTYQPGKRTFTVNRTWGTDHLILSGNLPPCTRIEHVFASWRPDLQFLRVFQHLLAEAGVAVSGQIRLAEHAPEGARPFYLLESDDLAVLAQTLMRESQNHYADLFLKTTARQVTGEGSFQAGATLAKTWLAEIGADGNLAIRDGSGLSAQNYLSPHQIIAMLDFALNRPYREVWLKTFPVFGAKGALARRGVDGGLARRRTWAKTGYIFRARNLSGYLETVAGEPLIFSMLVNNYGAPTAEIERAQDLICEWLVQLKPIRDLRTREQYRLFSKTAPPTMTAD